MPANKGLSRFILTPLISVNFFPDNASTHCVDPELFRIFLRRVSNIGVFLLSGKSLKNVLGMLFFRSKCMNLSNCSSGYIGNELFASSHDFVFVSRTKVILSDCIRLIVELSGLMLAKDSSLSPSEAAYTDHIFPKPELEPDSVA